MMIWVALYRRREFLLYIFRWYALGCRAYYVKAHFRGKTGTSKDSEFRQNEFDDEIEELEKMFDND